MPICSGEASMLSPTLAPPKDPGFAAWGWEALSSLSAFQHWWLCEGPAAAGRKEVQISVPLAAHLALVEGAEAVIVPHCLRSTDPWQLPSPGISFLPCLGKQLRDPLSLSYLVMLGRFPLRAHGLQAVWAPMLAQAACRQG